MGQKHEECAAKRKKKQTDPKLLQGRAPFLFRGMPAGHLVDNKDDQV